MKRPRKIWVNEDCCPDLDKGRPMVDYVDYAELEARTLALQEQVETSNIVNKTLANENADRKKGTSTFGKCFFWLCQTILYSLFLLLMFKCCGVSLV